MRVLHTYCMNYNIGDYALAIGVKNILRNNLPVDLIGDTNIQGREFNEYYINEVVNKKYDLLVIGGGGIIHGSHWPNGWFWLIDKELIKTIKIPFIVYGVGNNYFANETIPEKAINHLKETFKHASFFSVRNDGSYKRVLDQVGIDPAVVPDPGFHVNLKTGYKKPTDAHYVLIQLADDKPEDRYSSDIRRNKFISEMRETVKRLSKKYEVILAPHTYQDIQLSNTVIKGVDNCRIWDFGEYAFDHCDRAIAYYKYAQFVIAMRGHGQILPISFNTPVIAIHNHPKHAGLMRELNLSKYCIDIESSNFRIMLDNTVEDVIDNHSSLVEKYKMINIQLSKQTKDAFNKIKKTI